MGGLLDRLITKSLLLNALLVSCEPLGAVRTHEAIKMKLIRYDALVAKGVINNRMTLKRLIDLHGFPPGKLIGPNIRAWDETEVDSGS